jgi:hypothetical protein
MANVTGTITINGITDVEMARIWEMKAKHGNAFHFVPNQIQVQNPVPVPVRPGQPQQSHVQQPAETIYSNVMFTWPDRKGLEVVHEVMDYLLKKEEKVEAAAQ